MTEMDTQIFIDGGQAFPGPFYDDKGHVIDGADGMSLRDYFAAGALQALVQNVDWNVQTTDGVAGTAYAFADAMLRAKYKKV